MHILEKESRFIFEETEWKRIVKGKYTCYIFREKHNK